MRAMLTCRDTHGGLQGSLQVMGAPPAPGGGTGGAEPPAQPLWAPAHPAGAAHLHGPQRGFPVHPKDVGPAKKPRGDLSSAVRVFTSPNANLRSCCSLLLSLLKQPLHWNSAIPKGAAEGFGSGMLFHSPRTKNGLRELPAEPAPSLCSPSLAELAQGAEQLPLTS